MTQVGTLSMIAPPCAQLCDLAEAGLDTADYAAFSLDEKQAVRCPIPLHALAFTVAGSQPLSFRRFCASWRWISTGSTHTTAGYAHNLSTDHRLAQSPQHSFVHLLMHGLRTIVLQIEAQLQATYGSLKVQLEQLPDGDRMVCALLRARRPLPCRFVFDSTLRDVHRSCQALLETRRPFIQLARRATMLCNFVRTVCLHCVLFPTCILLTLSVFQVGLNLMAIDKLLKVLACLLRLHCCVPAASVATFRPLLSAPSRAQPACSCLCFWQCFDKFSERDLRKDYMPSVRTRYTPTSATRNISPAQTRDL